MTLPSPAWSAPLPIYINPEWWRVGHEKLRYVDPATYWVFGKRFSGKSTLIEAILTQYLYNGACGFDLYSARDNESLAWCRSPYKDKVLFVCGDSITLKSEWPFVRLGDFKLAEAESYGLVVTCPAFYSSEYEQNTALSHMVDILKFRREWHKVDVLLVREASRLLGSRILSGKVRNRIEAEYDFIDLIQEAYHTGVAVAVDSLRPYGLEISIREISNYVFIKTIGRLTIPREFEHLMRYIDPSYFRRMPVNEFVLYTDTDSVAVGRYDPVPWHVNRGENILRTLNIEIQSVNERTEIKPKAAKGKVTLDLHKQIIEKRNEGLSYAAIALNLSTPDLTITESTSRRECLEHEHGICLCVESGGSP